MRTIAEKRDFVYDSSRVVVDLASTGAITAVLSDALADQYEDVIFRPEN